MSEDTTNVIDATTDNAIPSDSVQISIEQICAAILSIAPVEVPLDNLIANYSGKTIAVNQNDETKAVTFSLADIPAQTENILETEQTPAE